TPGENGLSTRRELKSENHKPRTAVGAVDQKLDRGSASSWHAPWRVMYEIHRPRRGRVRRTLLGCSARVCRYGLRVRLTVAHPGLRQVKLSETDQAQAHIGPVA